MQNSVYSCNPHLLLAARGCWEAMRPFRTERRRNMRYCYGDQWGDRVEVDGELVREEDYIRSLGNEPLKNNLIRRLVKQVLGLYRSEGGRIQCVAAHGECHRQAKVMTETLMHNRLVNRADEVDARALEEFLISGMTVQRKYGWRNGREDCWTDLVSPTAFFVDAAAADCRGWDVEMVGEIHDVRLDALASTLARSIGQWQALADIYAPADYEGRLHDMASDFGMPSTASLDFFRPASNGLCRVVEVWYRTRRPSLLCHDRRTATLFRIEADSVVPRDPMVEARFEVCCEWRCAFLSPFGHVLAECPSPYEHGTHPYVFKAYPFVDGEIHSFVADIIDQQRYTNRLITLYDWVMRSSAKGVLLVPEESIPEGYSIDDIADEWARFNGVIAVKTRNGAVLPQQVSANAVNVGINELLQTQLAFMEDISGVTGALQGKAAGASVSGTLFQQQTRNATLSQLDLLDSFRDFILDGATKDLSNIRQFYTHPRSFAGKGNRTVCYDPAAMRGLDLTLRIR